MKSIDWRLIAGTALLAVMSGCAGGTATAPPTHLAAGASSSLAPTTAPASSANPSNPATASGSAWPTATNAATASPDANVTIVGALAVEPALAAGWQAGSNVTKPCTADPALDGKGNLWLIACWENQFWIVTPDGKSVEAWAGPPSSAFDFSWNGGEDAMGGAAFAPDGSFYTYEGGRLLVQHFSKDRQVLSSWGQFGRNDGQFSKPTAIGTDGAGNVYVCDASRNDVQVFDGQGNLVRKAAEHLTFGGFCYMAVAADGTVFLDALYKLHRSIERFDPQGKLTAVWDFTSISPDLGGVTLDDKGNLYVAGFANDQATATYELDPETGKLLHHWPSTGEMFAYDATHAALDVTDFNWSNVRQFLLGN